MDPTADPNLRTASRARAGRVEDKYLRRRGKERAYRVPACWVVRHCCGGVRCTTTTFHPYRGVVQVVQWCKSKDLQAGGVLHLAPCLHHLQCRVSSSKLPGVSGCGCHEPAITKSRCWRFLSSR